VLTTADATEPLGDRMVRIRIGPETEVDWDSLGMDGDLLDVLKEAQAADQLQFVTTPDGKRWGYEYPMQLVNDVPRRSFVLTGSSPPPSRSK